MKIMKKTFALAAAVSLVCLSSVGAMAANKLIVKDSTGGTDKFVVTDSGFIGVGHNAPGASLHIKGSVFPANALMVEGTAATAPGGVITYMTKTSGLPLAGEKLGFIYMGSKNGATPLHAAGMAGYAETAWGASSTPSAFAFETTPSGQATRIERVRITSVGNVGIGTPGPTQKLEVNGAVRINPTTAITKPVCGATVRGTLFYTRSTTSGVTDALEVCTKDSGENYAWRALY